MTIATIVLALIATPAATDGPSLTLLDFHATWCGPCRQVRPEVEQLARNGYPIKSYDIDQHPEVAQRYQVSAVPTFIVVDSRGRALARTEGYHPAAELAGLYRRAQAKVRPAPPQPPPPPPAAEPADDNDDSAEAAADDDEAEAEDGDEPERPAPTNPNPWATVVRIRVHGAGTIGLGSGTIIHSTEKESIILTCAHIFKIDGAAQQPRPSEFRRKITIDLFDGRLSGPRQNQVHTARREDANIPGQAIDYDFASDVGLIRIRPGRRLPAARVVPDYWVPKAGMKLTTVGCSEGQDATAWTTSIINPAYRMTHEGSAFAGGRPYEGIQCAHAPRQGRSGGGLFTSDGYIAGVCDFALPDGNLGLYACPRSIHRLLDRNRMVALYQPLTKRGAPTLVAREDRPRRSSDRTIARAQSPDGQEQGPYTLPSPHLMGLDEPGAEPAAPGRGKSTRRKAWQPIAGAHPAARRHGRDEDSDPAESLADSRRAGADEVDPEGQDPKVALEDETRGAGSEAVDTADAPSGPVPSQRKAASSGWRAVRPGAR